MSDEVKTEKHFSWQKSLMVILGTAVYALTVKFFLVNSEMVTGGSTGLSLALSRITPMSVAVWVFIIDGLMLLWGAFEFGRDFVLNTVLFAVAYPLILQLFDMILPAVVLTEDPLLNSLFAGMGTGVALGIILRQGASTGGMDIPALVAKKRLGVALSVSFLVIDGVILLLQIPISGVEPVLYGVITVIAYTLVMDMMLTSGEAKAEITIISPKYEEIKDSILKDLDRGVTVLYGEGGFLGQECKELVSVVTKRELPKIEKMVREIDPESFMTVKEVKEVRGRGFSLNKVYKEK